jgi:hypothetical protein
MNTNTKLMIISVLIGVIFSLLGYNIIDSEGKFNWKNFFIIGLSSVTVSLIMQILMPTSVIK